MEKSKAYIRGAGGFTEVDCWLEELDLGEGVKRMIALHKAKDGKYWLATDAATGLNLSGGKTRAEAIELINKAQYRRVCLDKETIKKLENELEVWFNSQDTDSDDERNLRNRGRRE